MLNKFIVAVRERFTKQESEADDYGLKRDVEIEVAKQARALMGLEGGMKSPPAIEQVFVLNPREELEAVGGAVQPADQDIEVAKRALLYFNSPLFRNIGLLWDPDVKAYIKAHTGLSVDNDEAHRVHSIMARLACYLAEAEHRDDRNEFTVSDPRDELFGLKDDHHGTRKPWPIYASSDKNGGGHV